MKGFFKTCFSSLVLTFVIISCGISRPDTDNDSSRPDRDQATDSDVTDADRPDSSRTEDEPDASDDAGSDSGGGADHDRQSEEDPAGEEDHDEVQDQDFSADGDHDETSDPDFSEGDEDDDYPEDEDPDEAAAPDESGDPDFPGAPDADEPPVDQDGPQFANSGMESWADGSPAGWRRSEGALSSLTLEQEDLGGGNFALRVTQPQNSKNKPGFESDGVETGAESPLPLRIEFRLKTGCRSKIAAEVVCGENSLKYKYVDETKTFVKSANYSYNQIELPSWTTLSVKFGEEMTTEFWRGQLCLLSFRTGSGSDFDASFDDFRIIY